MRRDCERNPLEEKEGLENGRHRGQQIEITTNSEEEQGAPYRSAVKPIDAKLSASGETALG